MLEDHIAPWIRQWGYGMAFHGEQGVESIHAEFNRLQRAACGIRNKELHMKSVMRSHHMRCAPLIFVFQVLFQGLSSSLVPHVTSYFVKTFYIVLCIQRAYKY